MTDIDEDEAALEAVHEADMAALRAISRPTFTCDQCGTTGSVRWMQTHDCARNREIDDTGGRCEDYPCCGHTDGDGCKTLESHTSEYWSELMHDLRMRGLDDYEIDTMLSREDY